MTWQAKWGLVGSTTKLIVVNRVVKLILHYIHRQICNCHSNRFGHFPYINKNDINVFSMERASFRKKNHCSSTIEVKAKEVFLNLIQSSIVFSEVRNIGTLGYLC